MRSQRLEIMLHDIRYAVRSLARYPGSTAVAVLVLAIGLGCTTAGFSVANWLLLRPVPGVRDGGRLATVWLNYDTPSGLTASLLSYPDYADVMRGMTALSGLAGYRYASLSVGVPNAASRPVEGQYTMANYLDVLGGRVQIGRWFSLAEDQAPSGSPVAVISDRLWRTLLNGDPRVLDRKS